MKLANKLLTLALATILFSSCSTSTQVTNLNIKKTSFYTTEWKLINDDNVLIKGYNGENVRIKFSEQNNSVTGYAGCNRFTSNLNISGSTIKFAPIASTKMACPNSKTEENFLQLLKETNRFEIKGKELFLYKNNILLLKLID